MTVGEGNDGHAGDIHIRSGNTTDEDASKTSGGIIFVATGHSKGTTSGSFVLRTPNAGKQGVSGSVRFDTGTSSDGHSGSFEVTTGSAHQGHCDRVTITVGLGDGGDDGDVLLTAGETTDDAMACGRVELRGGLVSSHNGDENVVGSAGALVGSDVRSEDDEDLGDGGVTLTFGLGDSCSCGSIILLTGVGSSTLAAASTWPRQTRGKRRVSGSLTVGSCYSTSDTRAASNSPRPARRRAPAAIPWRGWATATPATAATSA